MSKQTQVKTRTTTNQPILKENRRLTFYAALFNQPTVIEEIRDKQRVRFEEVVSPNAFSESLASSTEVLANIDHDENLVFAKRSDSTLLLQEDDYGLFASCYLPDTEIANSIIEDIDSGEILGTSFKFIPVIERWQAQERCELVQVKLYDVCLTKKPAYKKTKGEVHLRNNYNLSQVFASYNYLKFKIKNINKVLY